DTQVVNLPVQVRIARELRTTKPVLRGGPQVRRIQGHAGVLRDLSPVDVQGPSVCRRRHRDLLPASSCQSGRLHLLLLPVPTNRDAEAHPDAAVRREEHVRSSSRSKVENARPRGAGAQVDPRTDRERHQAAYNAVRQADVPIAAIQGYRVVLQTSGEGGAPHEGGRPIVARGVRSGRAACFVELVEGDETDAEVTSVARIYSSLPPRFRLRVSFRP